MTDASQQDGTSGLADTVAVIVVSGVGDDALGSGRDAVVETLVQDPKQRWLPEASTAQTTFVATADTGDTADDGLLRTGLGSPNLREPFPVPTGQVTSAGVAPDVHVYEMHWADLSRAQGPVQRLFYLVFAITLQVSTIGQEAVRRFAANDTRDTVSPKRLQWLSTALTVLTYWLAYIITPLILAQVALAAIVNIQLLLPRTAATVPSWVVYLVIGAVMVGVGWWVGGRTYRGGWTFDRTGKPWGYETVGETRTSRTPFVLIALTLACLVATTLSFADGACGDAGGCDYRDLTMQLAFLLFVGIVATAMASTAMRRHAATDAVALKADRRFVRRVIQGAYAAVPAGAILYALVVPPRSGGVAVRTANALTAIAMGPFRLAWLVMLLICAAIAVLTCLIRLTGGGDPNERRRLSATVMMSVMLGPVLYAIATSAMFLVFAAASRVYPNYAKSWPAASDLACPGNTILAPIVDCPMGEVPAPVEWGSGLVRLTVQPLGVALVLIAVLMGLIALFFAGYSATFRARGRHASAANEAKRQGDAFTNGLTQTGRTWLFVGLLVPTILITAAACIVFWTGQATTLGGHLTDVAFPLAYMLAILAVAGVGLKNVGFIGNFGGGFLKVLALVLDLIYDITTYLRVANPAIVAPRVQMIGRYRAVLAEVRARGYGHVVIMAHSQGSALSLATLTGDLDRSPALKPAPADQVPATLTLLTYGCPATQTYARRFPTQFATWRRGAPTITRWLNVYRAGDFIGRDIASPDQYDPRVVSTPSGGPACLQERCLGPGHHTRYFADERWRRVARHVVATPCPASLDHVDLDDLTVAVLDGPASGPDQEPTLPY